MLKGTGELTIVEISGKSFLNLNRKVICAEHIDGKPAEMYMYVVDNMKM